MIYITLYLLKLIHTMAKASFLCSRSLIVLLSIIIRASLYCKAIESSDLTLVGYVNQADGLGTVTVGLIKTLHEDLSINFIETRCSDFQDIDRVVSTICSNSETFPGKVSLFVDVLWYQMPGWSLFEKVPESKIKIAYSMLESTKIPVKWVEILNHHFDAVAVPDRFLVEAYKSSGVTIPIFELPLGICIEDLLLQPLKDQLNQPFVFGSTASYDDRKNHQLLIQAFAEEFGNSTDVILKINGRSGFGEYSRALGLVQSLGCFNIELTNKMLTRQEYTDFFRLFDCFVNLSKGEGFSICPREALALGIPCILTNNTAQTTLCRSGFVKGVPSTLEEPANYGHLFGEEATGVRFNSSVKEVRAALRDVYLNFQTYLHKAKKGKIWVKQYLWINLKQRYLNLIKPQMVFLGDQNVITDEYLMTNSPSLFSKYNELSKGCQLTY